MKTKEVWLSELLPAVNGFYFASLYAKQEMEQRKRRKIQTFFVRLGTNGNIIGPDDNTFGPMKDIQGTRAPINSTNIKRSYAYVNNLISDPSGENAAVLAIRTQDVLSKKKETIELIKQTFDEWESSPENALVFNHTVIEKYAPVGAEEYYKYLETQRSKYVNVILEIVNECVETLSNYISWFKKAEPEDNNTQITNITSIA